MSNIAIRVENLGKRYRIGVREPYKTLRDTITDAMYAPFRAVASTLNGRRSAVTSQSSDSFVWALRDVSFEIKRGEVVGIIGRNGAGKSTLLKILSRITEPTEGYAEIHGRVGSLLEVGTGFHPELTGRENIYLNGAILGMKRREMDRKFDEIIAFAEVEKFIDTPIKHYSSGMYLRLAFAVAAHLEPEILLVDEVLAVGDYAFQKKCLSKMGDISKEGRTVLFISHNTFSLQNLCTRGILLELGKVAAEGNLAAVIDRYLNLGGEQNGEVRWDAPDIAPGDERARLKAVRIISEDLVTGEVDISKDFSIEIVYWNLQAKGRRVISIHLYNSMGVCVLASANLPSASINPDPWYGRTYPIGLFRTSCTIPGCLLNDGLYSVSIYINGSTVSDSIILMKDILSFTVRDTGMMRKEYTGTTWIGAVRPRLNWQTSPLAGC